MSTNHENITEEPGLAESQQPTTCKSHPRLRRYLFNLGWLILLLGAIALITTLVLLSYKLKHPIMSIDSLSIPPSKLNLNNNYNNNASNSPSNDSSLINVKAYFSIWNRDQATFNFDSIRTHLLYRSSLYVGSADLPAGRVYAGSTFRDSVEVNATVDGILNHPDWARDLKAGSIALELSAQTVGGKIQGYYRSGRWQSSRHVDATVKCNVTVSVPNLAVLARVCD